MPTVFANNTSATVTSGGTTAPAAGTVESWTVSVASGFPSSLASGRQFHVADQALPSEKILVTAVSGTGPYTWTVKRGDEGTTPVAHAAGFTVQQVVTSGEFAGFAQVVQPSGDTSGVADAAAINAAIGLFPPQGGTVTLAATGQWYIACGQVSINRSGAYINARGCYINAVGTGDVFRMYDSSGTFWTVFGGGITGFPVIDGTSAGAGSCAVHTGDLFQPVVEAAAQNFTGAGSMGFHFDNANYWTEGLRGRVYAQKCTAAVVFDVTGAVTSTASFARADLDIYIDQQTAAYDGVVVQNGALVYDGSLRVRGNFVGATSALTSAAFRVTGTVPAGHPSAGSYAGIYDCRLDVGLECAANTFTPVTMAFGANNNMIKNCYGILDFGTDGAAANFTHTARIGNVVPFNGIINGDSVLTFGAQGFQSNACWGAASGLALGDFTAAAALASSGTVSTTNGTGAPRALNRVNPAANVTGVILQTASFDGQTCVVINESAFTVTFAAAATSHVADGTSDVIAAKSAAFFVWDGADTNLWYRCA